MAAGSAVLLGITRGPKETDSWAPARTQGSGSLASYVKFRHTLQKSYVLILNEFHQYK